MKKLMIAAAIVCAAVVSQAATFKWTTEYEVCDGSGSDTKFTSASTAYLINAAVLSQNDLYDAVAGGQSLADVVNGKTLSTAAMDGGMIDTQSGVSFPASIAVDSTVNAYMVLFDSNVGGGSLYFSEQLSKLVPSAKDAVFNFESGSSLDAPAADMTGFSTKNGGWVQASAVPEPTSGLLLLLGVAGLALRRRRA